jgi:CBS-domain-containing membrane protein
MTSPCVTVPDDCTLDECTDKMEEHQLRRMLVVDGDGCLCGIVAQADVALNAGKKDTGQLVKDLSRPAASREPVTI